MILQLLYKNMEKLKMLSMERIKENARYSSIINLLLIIQENKYETGLKLKGFVNFFKQGNEMMMKDALGNDEYRLPKDVKKEISKQLKIFHGGFDKASDIHVYLERLYPYVKPYPNCKVNKYHLTSFFYSEWLKYAVFEKLKSSKKVTILNHKTFMKDKVVKIDMDGISISIPTDKLDFT